MAGPITEFKDEYRFLSNFYPSPFVYNGVHFATNEHFYQAYKMLTRDDFLRVASAATPGQAKRLGRKSPMIKLDLWDMYKEQIMFVGLQHKYYNNPQLKQMLIDTDPRMLMEGNWWNDKYWGICLKTNEGDNRLGHLQMILREQLIRGE